MVLVVAQAHWFVFFLLVCVASMLSSYCKTDTVAYKTDTVAVTVHICCQKGACHSASLCVCVCVLTSDDNDLGTCAAHLSGD